MDKPRRRLTDRMPWRLLPVVGYLILALATAYAIGKVQSNVDKIEDVEARTFEAICERQREGLTRLRETKTILASTNGTMVALLAAVDPATEANEERFRAASAKLAADVATLQRGIKELDKVIPSRCPKP